MKFVSLNTIINDLLLIVRGAQVSQSEPISRRQVENWVHQYRSLLLSRELDKGNAPNPDYIQEIPFLKLEETPIEGTSKSLTSTYIDSGDMVLRTELELPKTIDLNHKSGFTYVGLPNGKELQLVPESRQRWQEYKKYTSKEFLVYLKNNKLHVTIPKEEGIPTHLHVRGVFEIPTEVGRFINPENNTPYFNLDSPYPIPNNLISPLKQMILESELNITVSSPSDSKNDSSHGLSENAERR